MGQRVSTTNTPSPARELALKAADEAFSDNCRSLSRTLFLSIIYPNGRSIPSVVQEMRAGLDAARLAYAEAIEAAAEIPQ